MFASPEMDGKQPYRPETPLKCYVHPAAKRVGITKALGWHSFRRTFATLLKGGGEDVKTVQELMRHANSRLTLDVYAQALTPATPLAKASLTRRYPHSLSPQSMRLARNFNPTQKSSFVRG